jgi:carboxyl-terminal processing protease
MGHRFLTCLLLPVFAFSAEKSPLLRTSDAAPAMEEMLAYHVEHKELTPLLMRRAFKIYSEQFDPYRTYFLESEIEPFLQISLEKLEKSLIDFRLGRVEEFASLNRAAEKAIVRARALRREVQKDLILKGIEGEVKEEIYSAYAQTEAELKERLVKQLSRLTLEEKKLNHLKQWTSEDRAKICRLWQRRFERREEPYLSKDQSDHFLTLHTLRSLAKSLDAHTCYFSPEEAAEMRRSLEKQFEGVGVVLREGIEHVIIEDLIKGGPAERSGKIAAGDLLIEIDGKALSSLAYQQILEEMKGNGKKELQLGTRKPGEETIVRTRLLREKIVMQEERVQFSSEPFAGGIIGKIVLPSFYEGGHITSSEQDMREAIKKLKKQGELKGLILDMRENAGGFLSQAVKIAGLFITRGVIVVSKYAQGEMKYLREIDGRIYYDGPLVILNSKGSASAAEIVAAALQDYGTAVIVGDERTYGKGTIQYQTVTSDTSRRFFKVTVGRYYTVSGRSAQIDGVKSDLLVPTPLGALNIGERFLEYPLPSDHIAPAYLDPLSDVEDRTKLWLEKNYLPHLQARQTFWQKVMPQLNASSAYRVKNDPNFQLFLEYQKKYQGLSPRAYSRPEHPAWGHEDLQMAEAINILKDMIELKR